MLLATDSDALAEDVFAALAGGGTTVSRIHAGEQVRRAVEQLEPDLVVLDMQIGNMGGIATSIDLRHEAEAGRLPDVKIVMLLDRDVDRWIAGEGKPDAHLVKPITSLALKRTVAGLEQETPATS